MAKYQKFRLTKEEYYRIEKSLRNGTMVSLSNAIGRELLEVRKIGVDKYNWKR